MCRMADRQSLVEGNEPELPNESDVDDDPCGRPSLVQYDWSSTHSGSWHGPESHGWNVSNLSHSWRASWTSVSTVRSDGVSGARAMRLSLFNILAMASRCALHLGSRTGNASDWQPGNVDDELEAGRDVKLILGVVWLSLPMVLHMLDGLLRERPSALVLRPFFEEPLNPSWSDGTYLLVGTTQYCRSRSTINLLWYR